LKQKLAEFMSLQEKQQLISRLVQWAAPQKKQEKRQ
jgi:hypothetical protein